MAGTFGAMMATVSPTPMPRLASAEARRRARAPNSAYVNTRSPWITAGLRGYTAAARSRKLIGVSGAWLAGLGLKAASNGTPSTNPWAGGRGGCPTHHSYSAFPGHEQGRNRRPSCPNGVENDSA